MLRILDASEDASAWNAQLAKLHESLRDIYFGPHYAALHAFEIGSRALLMVFEASAQVWLYPFIIRPVPVLRDYELENTWFDLESPYGYGGPLSNSDDAHFLRAAHQAFENWCAEQRVVTEFVRLHPLLRNDHWLDPQVELVYDRSTVSLNLAGISQLEIGKLPISKMSRYMIRRAMQSDVQVESVSIKDNFDKFVTLYKETMARRGASELYYFNDRYFAGLRDLAEHNGWLLVAKREGRWLGAGLFLRGTKYLHYHLSASTEERQNGATNLLLYEAAAIGSRHGLSQLHLGGGRTSAAQDSLLEFKKSMATDCHSFQIGKRIHDREVYAMLKDAWAKAFPLLVDDLGHRLQCYRIGSN
jgi:hypothetical protein